MTGNGLWVFANPWRVGSIAWCLSPFPGRTSLAFGLIRLEVS